MNNNILLNYVKEKDWIFGKIKQEKSRYPTIDWYLFTNSIFVVESRRLPDDKKFMREILKQVGEDEYIRFLKGEIDTLYGAKSKHKHRSIHDIQEKILSITPQESEMLNNLPTATPMNLVITETGYTDKMIYADLGRGNIIIINRDYYDLTEGHPLKYQYGYYGKPLLYLEDEENLIWIMPIRITEDKQEDDDLKILADILNGLIHPTGENREWLEVE